MKLLPRWHRCFSFFRNYLNNAIDDLKDPKRLLPRSIVVSLLLCIFIYLLMFSSYFTALSPYEILMSEATAVTFVERVYSPLLYVIPIGVTMSCVGGKFSWLKWNFSLCSLVFQRHRETSIPSETCSTVRRDDRCKTFSTVLNETLLTSFVVAGRDGLMPHIFSMKHHESNVPMIAILCEIILSAVFLFFMSNIGQLIICVGMINWICKYSSSPCSLRNSSVTVSKGILLAAVGLIVLRFKHPDRERPLKVPLVIPILFITVLVILIVTSALTDLENITTSLLLLSTAIPAYVIGVMWKKKPSSLIRRYNEFAITLQKVFHVVHDEHTD